MADRRVKRFARRLQVRFWKQGEEEARSAYTTNVSTTGMFLGTSSPLKPGSRLRIELIHGDKGFMLEGEVVHAARVSPLLSQVKTSGMGVRFLTVPELISEILPAMPPPTAEEEDLAAADSPAEPPAEPAPQEQPTTPEEPRPAPEPARAVPPGRPAQPPAEPLAMQEGPVVELHFESLPHFLKVLQRDIASGGLFVPNVTGFAVDERVEIDLHLPAPVSRVMRVAGRVVNLVDAAPEEGNLLSGIGVQISEPEVVTRQLQRMIYAE